MITRLDVFEDFIKRSYGHASMMLMLALKLVRVRYDNDTIFKPKVDEDLSPRVSRPDY